MKKTLIAAAVLALSGAAMAQSTVQIYGIADIWVGSEKDGLNAKSISKVGDGGISGSRLGFRGKEDLGGGLSATFNLETALDIDNGAAFGAGFDRVSTVGLAGGFGEVTVGNSFTAFDDVNGLVFANFDSAFAPEYYVFETTGYTTNPKNQFKYISPSFGGFSGSASYSLDENDAVKENVTALALTYAAGPLTVAFGYQNEDDTASDIDRTRLGAAYDLGIAVVKANYGRFDDSSTDSKANEFSLGADFPLSDALTLSASYARATFKTAGVKDGKNTGYGISAMYAMSKRTSLYAGVVSSTEKDAADVKTDKYRLYAVGVKHTF